MPDERKQTVTRPHNIERSRPRYPKKAQLQGVRGKVFLAAVINEQGDVTCVRVLRGLPLGVTDAAVEALQSSKFEPARANGTPISGCYRVEMSFFSPGISLR